MNMNCHSLLLPQNMGFNLWAAFNSAAHHQALLTGRLLLREDEVTAVLSAILKNGLKLAGMADFPSSTVPCSLI